METHEWIAVQLEPPDLMLLGLPTATAARRKLVSDGVLIALTEQNEHGWTLVVSHIYAGLESMVPGRMPTILELREARQAFIPGEFVLMAALLEQPPARILARMNRTETVPLETPVAPSLTTSVRCVQVHVEAITDDVVFGGRG
jgi:hypothetical protein